VLADERLTRDAAWIATVERLVSDLTYQCCRILRAWLSQRAERNKACRDAFAEYLANIQLFLSHSKHDGDKAGETLARAIRDHLHEQSGYASFSMSTTFRPDGVGAR